jgi:aryl-alcohol dehydrogenase-like predicted oxidoreductase
LKRTGKRSEIFLATKFGAGSPSGKPIDCAPAYVREALNKSLEKLGVDYIDLYYTPLADVDKRRRLQTDYKLLNN